MSTIDPAIAARARRARRPSGVRVVVLLVLQFAGGALAGFGWGSFGAMSEEMEPPWQMVIAIPVGTLLLILSSIAWAGTVMRRTDIGLAYGTAAALVGGGGGVLVASTAVPRPGATIVLWVGIALIALGAAFLMLGLAAAASRARIARRQREIVRTGQLATATVSDKGYLVFGESTRILTTVTFTFRDLSGTQRWVQRAMVIRAEAPLENGDETRLWYDGSNPGDADSIVVEAAMNSPVRPMPGDPAVS
jgi:hypothetical protein